MEPRSFLTPGPVPLPQDWVERVNAPETEGEFEAVRRSVQRSCPFGSPVWQEQMAARLGLKHTLRPVGRPKKPAARAGSELF